MLENNDFDSVNNGSGITLRKKIILTSFDSGSWYIPALPVTVEINNNFLKLVTDSVLINVDYSASDSSDILRDIKPVMEVKVKDHFWFFMLGSLIVLTGIILLLYNYFSRQKAKPEPVLHSALSPYDEAINDLKILSEYNLDLPAEVKHYHTQLGFILKRYLSRLSGNNLLNKTTGDLLLILKEQNASQSVLSPVAETLRIGDAVKFAKYIPPLTVSVACASAIKEAVEKLEKNKP